MLTLHYDSGPTPRNSTSDTCDTVCCICYKKMTAKNKTVVLPCYHVFCYHCIVHWIKIKQLCPLCMSPTWMILYSIKSNENYKIISVRACSLQLEAEPKDITYTPHLFINSNGEYECTVTETNRIRALIGLNPLEE